MTSNDATPGGSADVIRAFLQAQDAHDVPEQLRCLADDVVHGDVALGLREEGRAAVEELLRSLEDDVSMRPSGRCGAPTTGPRPRTACRATGRTSVLPGVSVGRVRDGRIAENRDYWNRAGHLGQLGLVPGVPAAATSG